jgi:hypothetical protein
MAGIADDKTDRFFLDGQRSSEAARGYPFGGSPHSHLPVCQL